MRRPVLLVVCGFLASAISIGASSETSPYAGMHRRHIKALSTDQIEDLRAGRGMGMALAAELNSYPGPTHVIELARELDLSNAQLSQTKALFQEMQQAAVPLGQEVLAKETELDHAFASAQVEREGLRRLLTDIAGLQGELRYTHLQYHLAMRELLRPEQVAAYDRLRGYGNAAGGSQGAHGHKH